MLSTSPKTATLMMRRSSAGVDGQFLTTAVPVRANFDDIRQHLKHLGPSNPATNPNKTRSTTVKVKPGSGVHQTLPLPHSIAEHATEAMAAEEDDETTSLLKPQTSCKDSLPAPTQTYGSVSPAITVQHAPQTNGVSVLRLDQEEQADKSTQTSAHSSLLDLSSGASTITPQQQQEGSPSTSPRQLPTKQQRENSSGSSTSSKGDQTLTAKRPYVRSGSITENVVESRGVRKVVLQTSPSSEAEESSATITSPPEQPRLLGRSTFGLFARDQKDGKDKEAGKEPGPAQEEGSRDLKRSADSAEEHEDEDDEEEIMSPVGGDEDGTGSGADAAAAGGSGAQQTQAGPSSSSSKPSGGGGGGRKKNRRKKRKGGKS